MGRKQGLRHITWCSVEGCALPHWAKGLCSSHYNKGRIRDREAMNAQRQAKRAEDPDAWRLKKRARRAGFTVDLLLAVQRFQNGFCDICKFELATLVGPGPQVECVDHAEAWENGVRVPSETTANGKKIIKTPRGILCGACNTSLGYYEFFQRPAGLRIACYEDYLSNTPVMRLQAQQAAE